MKRIPVFTVIFAALSLAACSALAPGAAATPTPPPTYTPLPSPTATFLPSPTPLPTETPGTPATPTPSALQVVLAFGSNLRSGPGLSFEVLDRLPAGETLQVIGRDQIGQWLLVTTADGAEGWVALRQIQGPVDVARIPLAEDLPDTPTPGPGTGTPEPQATGTATTEPTGADQLLFEVVAGGAPVCRQFTWAADQPYPVTVLTQPIQPFEYERPDTITSPVKAFQFFAGSVPTFIQPYIQGSMTPAGCSEADKLCTSVTFTFCAQAPASATTGGFEYPVPFRVLIGDQSYDQFYQQTTFTVPVTYRVVAP